MPEKQSGDLSNLPNTSDSSDLRWKQLTAHGNDAFADDDYQQASNVYESALKEAHRLFDLALKGAEIEAVPILVISYHNVAENERSAGRSERVLELYNSAFEHIVGTAESRSAPASLRAACVRNLSHAITPFVSLLRESGAADPEVAALVERARRVALALENLSPDSVTH